MIKDKGKDEVTEAEIIAKLVMDVFFKPWLNPCYVNFQSILKASGHTGSLLDTHPETVKAVEEWDKKLSEIKEGIDNERNSNQSS